MTYREEQLILKRIEELEKHQEEQTKVLDDIEDRLSNLENPLHGT